MLTKTDNLLSKHLTEIGALAPGVLKPLIDQAASSKDSLFTLLITKGLIPEENLLRMVSELIRIPLIELSSVKVDPQVIEKVPLKIAEYYKIAPIRLEKKKLTIAVSTPLDLRTQDDIRAHLGYEIDIMLAREKDIAEALKKFYGFAAGTIGEMVSATPETSGSAAREQSFEKIENIEKLAGDASIAKLVNQIIFEAYKKRATDIHIEPYRGKVKLRYRIDGILYNTNVQTEMSRFILPILSRIKIMSNLNIVERRLPQDGRAIVKVEDATLDLRVSSIPTPYGEGVVIRLLPMNRIFDLTQLGLRQSQLEIFESLIKKPHGVIFITGPTGSGKSTTLYACLNKINTDERKIITIEDPVEYEMEGVTQIQVVANIGLDFARGLRSILRHDPDVIMVGEVRDLETAEIAIRVALTGHLVFSTLHTNDAASGVTRLVDIGVEPYLVASSIEAFIAQRLVRTICPHCKEEDKSPSIHEMKKQIIKEMALPKNASFVIYRGKGCNQCNQTGFWGRVAIYEILLMSEKIRELVMKKATASELKRQTIAEGMKTLRQDGWHKVIDGLTTPEEVLKVAEAERNQDDMLETEGPETVKSFLSEVEPGVQTAALKEPDMSRYADRRLFVRLNSTVNIRYKVVKSIPPRDSLKKSSEFTVTKNISAGGLLFAAKEILPLGTILELKIEIPEDKTVECLARVIRGEEIENEKVYETAVCFLDLSASDRSRFDKFIIRETK